MLAGRVPIGSDISIAKVLHFRLIICAMMAMVPREMTAQTMYSVVVIGEMRMRQDLAGADHGCGLGRPADRGHSGTMVVAHHKGEGWAPAPIAAGWGKNRAGERLMTNEIEAVNGRMHLRSVRMVMGTARPPWPCITEDAGHVAAHEAPTDTIPEPHASDPSAGGERQGRRGDGHARAKAQRPLTRRRFRNARWCAGDRRIAQRHSFTDRDRQTAPNICSDLEAFDQIGREVPVLIDLKPSASIQEHSTAGGCPKLMASSAIASIRCQKQSTARHGGTSSPPR